MILFNYFFLAKSCPPPEPESPQAIGEFVKSKRQEVNKQNRSLTLQVFLWALDWVRGQLVDDVSPEGWDVCVCARACICLCVYSLAYTREHPGRHGLGWGRRGDTYRVRTGFLQTVVFLSWVDSEKTVRPSILSSPDISWTPCLPLEGVPLLPLPVYLPWPCPQRTSGPRESGHLRLGSRRDPSGCPTSFLPSSSQPRGLSLWYLL